ncbi:hypothetical protein DVA67_024695 [Solirubrobacter sp. CPCC 204708]|uniref:Lipoprotein n=1 Tax=Solirubrobacter deserti TaxID=2282478 RepID=A0ABT4RNS7_9ACTN|nr:hypothetical protein [Solirubrobacter deserti]MBE2319198.1 hypothetical protein [Solirubrobacter deserti]MDA0140204.1 hypothetical protein [Solirubrobacter deserti]
MRWLVLIAALALAGCGSPAPDLFEVKRSGADRNANLTLLVSDDGTVTCNGGDRRPITNETLLQARELERELSAQAELHLQLPAGPNPVLSYRVRMEAGTLGFADTSRPLPSAFAQLTAFTSDVSERICGIVRR